MSHCQPIDPADRKLCTLQAGRPQTWHQAVIRSAARKPCTKPKPISHCIGRGFTRCGQRSSKRLETVSGAFVTFRRWHLVAGSRATVKRYLEARGGAVYSDEKLKDLRAAALADYDGESSQ